MNENSAFFSRNIAQHIPTREKWNKIKKTLCNSYIFDNAEMFC